jgi:hypothetical protein
VTITSHFSTVHAKALSEPHPSSCPSTPPAGTASAAAAQQQGQGSHPSTPGLRTSAKLFSGNNYGRLLALGPSTPTARGSGALSMARASHDGDRATIGVIAPHEAILHEKEAKGSGRVIGRLSLQHSRPSGGGSSGGAVELGGVTVHTPGSHFRGHHHTSGVTPGEAELPPLAPAAVPAAGSGPLVTGRTLAKDVHRTSFSGVHPPIRGLNVAAPALAFSRRLLMRSPSTTGSGAGTTAAAAQAAALTAATHINTQQGPQADSTVPDSARPRASAETAGDRSGSHGGSTAASTAGGAVQGMVAAVQVQVPDGGSGRVRKPLDDNERMLSLQVGVRVRVRCWVKGIDPVAKKRQPVALLSNESSQGLGGLRGCILPDS